MTSDDALLKVTMAILGGLQALYQSGKYEAVVDGAQAALDLDIPDGDADIAAALRSSACYLAAAACYEMNHFEDALRFAESGIAAADAHGPTAQLVARNLGQRAVAYDAIGDLVNAERDFRAALDTYRELGDPEPTHREQIQSAYAQFLMERRQGPEALALVHDLSGDPTGPGRGAGFSNMLGFAGQLDESPGNQSEQHFHQAYRQALAAGQWRHAGVVACNIGMMYFDRGDHARAEAVLKESVELLERAGAPEQWAVTKYNLGCVYLMDRDRRDEAVACFKQALKVMLEVAPQSVKVLLILQRLAWVRLAEHDYRRARAALRRGIELYEQTRPSLGASESEHQYSFGIYRGLVESHLAVSVVEDWPDEAFELIERSKARAWSEALKLPSADVGRFRMLGLADILVPRAYLLDFFVGANFSYVAYGFNGRLGVRRIDMTESEFRDLVEAATFELLATPTRGGRRRESLDRLAAVLFEGVVLPDVRAICILPDGPLWSAPFDALTWPGSDGPPLAPTSIAPSMHIVRSMREKRRGAAPAGPTALVAARPDAGPDVPDLVGAQSHAEILRRFTPDCTVLAGRDATPEAVLRLAASASHIHIAAHAVAWYGEEPYIILSDGQGGAARLGVESILATQLSAELVFLAACSTTSGPASAGEGLISIARAFLFAGARYVVGALWPVPDQETAEFVSWFYGALSTGEPVLEAMNTARLRAREVGLSARTWGAFQLIGDPFAEIHPATRAIGRREDGHAAH